MKRLVMGNIGVKIAAVILAVILWFFVTSRGQSEISMEAPVELRNVPNGFESVKQSIKSVSVNIKGQERLFKNLRPSDIRVYVDLSKGKKGKGIYYIDKDSVTVPATMTVTNISPSSVLVVLEQAVVKTVPVKPVIIGTPKRGFAVSSVEVVPKDVTIKGIRSAVSRINILRTEPVDIADLEETSVQDVRLDTTGRNIRIEVQEVSVKVVIRGRK